MDWRLYKAVYGVSLHHHWVGTLFNAVEQASIPAMVVLTTALWFLSRPGGSRKWKLACGSAFAAAALAFGIASVIHHIWARPRPYMTHHIAHPWSNTTDASFPSDHATVTFAIAFAVLSFDGVAGAVFLVVAAIITVGRLFIGAHYPGDVLTGFAVGLAAAGIVVRLLPGLVDRVVRGVERLSDPLLAPVWRLVPSRNGR
ncbi:MAG TPA: phosphatase PAP2 family protein [Gaiellaceae bacterium]|nr:phosphatase PAP2 family protein [Gaiellaceae bacterium]